MRRVLFASALFVLVVFVLIIPRPSAAQSGVPCDTAPLMQTAHALTTTGNTESDLLTLVPFTVWIDTVNQACHPATATPTLEPPTETETLTPSPTVPSAQAARTATAQVVFDNRTATAEGKTATADFVSQYHTIDRRELVSYADNHQGENVKIRGRVFNIIDGTDLQMYLEGTNDAVVVRSTEYFVGIYENSFVTVYGTVNGYATFQNSFGGTISQPEIVLATVVKSG